MFTRPPLALALAVAAMMVTPAVPFAGAGATTVTFYLHSHMPMSVPEQHLESLGVSDGPWMDETAPTASVSKASYSVIGNPTFRKNPHLNYWGGAVHGNLTNFVATLWVQTQRPGQIQVLLFGDGGVSTSQASIAMRVVDVPAGPPSRVVVDFGPSVFANVDKELVLSTYSNLNGLVILHDSVDHPSSVRFDKGPYDGTPPAVIGGVNALPSPGWDAVKRVEGIRAHRETSIVVNPTNEDEMIACSPSGVPQTSYGSSYFYITRDGGDTWALLDVETEQTDGRQYAFEGGDCDVAYDAAGTMYSADTWLGSLSVGHSRDGGLTWSGTPIAASAPVVDRPWLVGGPAGVVYLTYQDVQFGMPTAIWFAKSTDHGVTWSAAVPVAVADKDRPFSWEGNLVVSADGQHLWSVHTRRLAVPALTSLDNSGPELVGVSASHDGGLTWTETAVTTTSHAASFLYPSIGRDAGGGLHVVYASRAPDNADHPIWYSFSGDDGASWSTPRKVLAGGGAYSPWVEGGAAGEAVIQWLGTPSWNATGVKGITMDWYLYWAKVTGAGTAGETLTSGTTTTTPIFVGKHTETPEFNQVRLTQDGRMHIGASVYHDKGGGDWDIFYQSEI